MWFLTILGKRLRKVWNVEDLMHLENWNLKWRISRRTTNSPLPTWGSLLGVNCLVVFPIHFNPISFLFLIFPNFLILNISNITSDFTPVQSVLRSLSTLLMFINVSSHSMEYKEMLYVTNHIPYLGGLSNSFSKSFINFYSWELRNVCIL